MSTVIAIVSIFAIYQVGTVIVEGARAYQCDLARAYLVRRDKR